MSDSKTSSSNSGDNSSDRDRGKNFGGILSGFGSIFSGLGSAGNAAGGIFYHAGGFSNKDNQTKLELERIKLEQAKQLASKPTDYKKIIIIGVVLIIILGIIVRSRNN